ncbi:MAG: hypothetical protein GY865_00085 [candidate division Zixibacteria bacterium]|nr:hypothetical protein [candidate division Zixibacteria bacterium]
MKIHLLINFDEDWIERLKAELDTNIVLTYGKENDAVYDSDVIISGLPKEEILERSKKIHTLVIPWAGLPKQTRELMLQYPNINIYNIHHNAIPTAETAFSMMLTIAKDIISIDRDFRKFDWSPRYSDSNALTLSGKTALILGYGAIGKLIGKYCAGMGMNIIATKWNADSANDNIAEIFSSDKINELLPKADVLFICAPLTPETEGLIGKNELSQLPDDAILINIARGDIINESDLYNELKSGRIRAGLDVWYNYPKDEVQRANTEPSKFPFHELDNVVVTPHLAGHCKEIETMRINKLAKLLNKLVSGEEIDTKVNPEIGY